MYGRKKKVHVIITGSVVVVAYICGILVKCNIDVRVFGFMRALIYIGIFILWNVRIRCIVQQLKARKYLIVAGRLIVFWFFIRTLKYEFILSVTGGRYCWYLYYLPMLFVPVMALLTALTIGKPDSERPKYKINVFRIVSGFLFMIVLTNDWHQLVFTFPGSLPHNLYSDRMYAYGPLYFPIVGWMAGCGIAALAVMCFKCRVPNAKKKFFLTLIPIGLALIYTIVYCTGLSWLRFWFGDITVVHSLLFITTFEICISFGMIRSNTRYAELFEASADCSAQIVDKDFCVRYSACGAQRVKKWQMKEALKGALLLEDGKELHAMPISGGYAIWTENNCDLLKKEEELKKVKKELQERNELLKSKYIMEKKHLEVLEQNQLYDLLQAVTQKQIKKIELLLQCYQRAEVNSNTAKEILAKIAVLCSYIKRRKHLELITVGDCVVHYGEMEMAFSESLYNLGLLGVKSSLFVNTKEYINGSDAIKFYEFFEEVVETGMGHLHSLDVRVTWRKSGLRLTVTAECNMDLSELCEKYPEAQFDNYDDEQTYLLVVQHGGEDK